MSGLWALLGLIRDLVVELVAALLVVPFAFLGALGLDDATAREIARPELFGRRLP